MYGGSNEVFGKNENFPLVLDIKLHLKIPVNYQLQISPPPNHEGIFIGGQLKTCPTKIPLGPVVCSLYHVYSTFHSNV